MHGLYVMPVNISMFVCYLYSNLETVQKMDPEIVKNYIIISGVQNQKISLAS